MVLFVQVPRIYSGCTSFIGNGISILIPRRSGILEWIRYQRMGSHKVTIELPLNWYENKDLLGFALCCVYESADTADDEPHNASACESENEESSQPYCTLSIQGNNQSTIMDSFSWVSYCANVCVSDIVWVIFYPKVAFKEAIKLFYQSNQWTHFMASFGGFRRVEQCGIRLIYAEEYEQKHPTMTQGSTSHGNFGEHGSVREDTDSKAHNKRNPTEQSPREESHHKRFRETQD